MVATKKTKTAKSTKTKTSRKPFGGYLISFAKRKDTLESVFGKKPIAPGEMNKKIWAFIKENNLSNK